MRSSWPAISQAVGFPFAARHRQSRLHFARGGGDWLRWRAEVKDGGYGRGMAGRVRGPWRAGVAGRGCVDAVPGCRDSGGGGRGVAGGVEGGRQGFEGEGVVAAGVLPEPTGLIYHLAVLNPPSARPQLA